MHLGLWTIVGLAGVGAGAGFLGAMVGIGGGVLLVPALAILFDVDLKIAIATSLVAVVGTSTAAGSVYLRRGLPNMRLGMTLEITTTIGGILGGVFAVRVSQYALSVLFSALMLVTAALMLRSKRDLARGTGGQAKGGEPREKMAKARGWEESHTLGGAYFDARTQTMVKYKVVRLWAGALVAAVAGCLSGMLGVGGGFLKVPAMNIAMRVPLRVAAATSNVMIGVTAIASLFVYFAHGYVHPTLAAPIVLGVVGGALGGTVLSARVSPKLLRFVLAGVLVIVAVEMVLRARGVPVV